MSNRIVARLRTYWPLAVGTAAAWLTALIARVTGLDVDPVIVAAVLGTLCAAAAWEIGTRMERSTNPAIAAIGRWLVSAGQDTGTPVYPDRPASEETVAALSLASSRNPAEPTMTVDELRTLTDRGRRTI
jgi:hypothetical protein